MWRNSGHDKQTGSPTSHLKRNCYDDPEDRLCRCAVIGFDVRRAGGGTELVATSRKLARQWLFWKGRPFAVSYSIHGKSTTLNGLITNKYNIPMKSTAPATYRMVGKQTEIISETTSKNFKFIIRTTSESGTLSGTMNGMKIILNRGPISSLPQYYNAYAHACD